MSDGLLALAAIAAFGLPLVLVGCWLEFGGRLYRSFCSRRRRTDVRKSNQEMRVSRPAPVRATDGDASGTSTSSIAAHRLHE